MAAHADASDLRKPLRASATDEELSAAIDRAIGLKPKGHDFIIDCRHNRLSVSRHMSVTRGQSESITTRPALNRSRSRRRPFRR